MGRPSLDPELVIRMLLVGYLYGIRSERRLNALDQELDARYEQTNKNLLSGKNPHLTQRPDGTFHVSTPKQDEVECLSLAEFFPERKYISMLEMLATVDQATNFLDEFEHWQIKNQRTKPSKKVLFAGIIGFGCDIGHRKLAQISKQIGLLANFDDHAASRNRRPSRAIPARPYV